MSAIFSRRSLLRGLVGGAGLATFGALPSFLRLAQAAVDPTRPRYYIFVYFQGGWDVLLSLDPRDPARFNNSNMDETFIQPGYEYLVQPSNAGQLVDAGNGMVFGPYIGDLSHHAGRLAVVRGMSMETLTHEVGRRRFITGRTPSGLQARGSSVATWMASLMGEQQLIPNMSVKVESYNVDQPVYASALRVAGVSDLLTALSPGATVLSAPEEQQIDQLLADFAKCPAATTSNFCGAAETGRLKAKAMVEEDLASLFNFMAATPQMEALRDHYGITGTGTTALNSIEAQAAMAVTALTSGLTRSVSVQLAEGLDTHYDEWTTDQGPAQERGFNAVARMVEDLAERPFGDTGASWLDHTVIVGFSEFSRTSLLNANFGRDHSLTNACFLLGGSIRGGRVIGRSSDTGMAPVGVDLLTGQAMSGGEILLPEHIMRTLFVEAGVTDDVADLRVEAISALLG